MKNHVANNTKTTGGITGKGFKPGRSGNPSGRPKSADFAKEVRAFLQEPHPKRRAQSQLRAIIERLAEHDPKILLHYAFGKPAEMECPRNEPPGTIIVRHAHEIDKGACVVQSPFNPEDVTGPAPK
jgi:hypothetical protein